MRLTATRLVAYHACPRLFYVVHVLRRPMPFGARARAFGNAIHAAIAAYERNRRSLDVAFEELGRRSAMLPEGDVDEARAILRWRHGFRRESPARAMLIEGPLSTSIAGEHLEARLDRLERVGEEMHLVELKTGRRVDPELVRVQAAILAFAVWRVLGALPSAWILEDLRTRRILPLAAERDPAALTAFVRSLARAMEAGDWRPAPYRDDLCTRCPARASCPRFGAPADPEPPARSLVEPSLFSV